MNGKGRPREGWEEAFRSMAECGDDRLLDEPGELVDIEEVCGDRNRSTAGLVDLRGDSIDLIREIGRAHV